MPRAYRSSWASHHATSSRARRRCPYGRPSVQHQPTTPFRHAKSRLSLAKLCGFWQRVAQAGITAQAIDESKLDSARLRPQNLAHYDGADLVEQAAGLIVGIALAHACSDANKRLALAAGGTFLRLNGLVVTAQSPVFAEQLLVVVNRVTNLPRATAQFVDWLRANTAPLAEMDAAGYVKGKSRGKGPQNRP